MGQRLAGGDAVLLFAEGQSDIGTHVLPFRSALVGAAQQAMVDAGKGGLVWDEAALHEYLRDPKAKVKGTKMVFPGLKKELLAAAMKTFYDVRNLPGLKKKPSTSELLDWLKLLVAEDIPVEALQSRDDKVAVPPLVGALLKNEQDVSLFEKLVFMQRHNR